MAGKTSTVVAVLAGAAVGALGILFAPDEGKNKKEN
jgi:gas vesicle protein